MSKNIEVKTAHDLILTQIIELVWKYAAKNQPSPSISHLSVHSGFSEELILESLEYGKTKPVSILQ